MYITDANTKAARDNAAVWSCKDKPVGNLTVPDYLSLMIGGPEVVAVDGTMMRAEFPDLAPVSVHWSTTWANIPGTLGTRGPASPVLRGLGLPSWCVGDASRVISDWMGCVIVRWYGDNADNIAVFDLAPGSIALPPCKRVHVFAFNAGSLYGEVSAPRWTLSGGIGFGFAGRKRWTVNTPRLRWNYDVNGPQVLLGIPPFAQDVQCQAKNQTGAPVRVLLNELPLNGSGAADGNVIAPSLVVNAYESADMSTRYPISQHLQGYQVSMATASTNAICQLNFGCEI